MLLLHIAPFYICENCMNTVVSMYTEHGQGDIDRSDNEVRCLATFGKSLVINDHE